MLSLWWMWAGLAFAGRFDDVEADLRAAAWVELAPDEVTEAFSDLQRASGLFDGDCVRRWVVGVPDRGEGARGRVTWTPGAMRRRLTVVVDQVVPGRRVVWDHLTDRGFYVYVDVSAPGPDAPPASRARVDVRVPLEAPGWPLTELFHTQIRPRWQQCFEDALRRLDSGALLLPTPEHAVSAGAAAPAEAVAAERCDAPQGPDAWADALCVELGLEGEAARCAEILAATADRGEACATATALKAGVCVARAEQADQPVGDCVIDPSVTPR